MSYYVEYNHSEGHRCDLPGLDRYPEGTIVGCLKCDSRHVLLRYPENGVAFVRWTRIPR